MRILLGTRSLLALCLLLPVAPTEAREDLAIHHSGMSCIPESDFAVVVAEVSPRENLRSVKLYFRSRLYPDFYYVEMKPFEDTFVGILPQPSAETPGILYYIEIMDNAFNSTRTAELAAPVRDPCSERKKAAAYLAGKDPGIVVGATTNGASSLPPGFKAIGIVGTITAAGAAASVGGGLGASTVIVAAAAAAGAGGAVIVATGGSSSTTTVSASGSATTSAATTTVSGGPPPGGSTTTSSIPSSPTTTTSGGSTTTSPVPTTSSVSSGSSSTTTTSTTSTSSSTSTSTSTSTSVPASSTTTTTVAAAPPVACFQVTSVGLCTLRLDATCSTGTIDQYEWQLDTGGALDGPVNVNGPVVVTHTYGTLCVLVSVTNLLTVRGPSGQNSVSRNYRFLLQRTERSTSTSTFGTTLVAADDSAASGGVSARVVVNGSSSREVGASSPVSVSFPGRGGRNVVEATWMPGFRGTGTWLFDLASVERLVAGSIAADDGEVLVLEPRRILFRLNGARPTPIRFHFELSPDSPDR